MMFIGPWELIIVFVVGCFIVGAIISVLALTKRQD